MMIKLNEILQEFFGHIQSMEINKGEMALDKEKIEYMRVVKNTATINLNIISSYPYKLNLIIQEKKQEFKQGNKGSQSAYSSRDLYH